MKKIFLFMKKNIFFMKIIRNLLLLHKQRRKEHFIFAPFWLANIAYQKRIYSSYKPFASSVRVYADRGTEPSSEEHLYRDISPSQSYWLPTLLSTCPWRGCVPQKKIGAIGNIQRLMYIVVGDKNTNITELQTPNDVLNILSGNRVDTRKRFVKQW